eukprot:CAMPEP_0181172832 /NCGR_PEP_ID=MMETSP1096-20121128/2660_1 /TAXON_ID=156174 ORGANISM="Chrysochromulina ericina, Strain CCMP281" /NCGR_SAMPLE_ID=MMETSP1096 /ASSEMBLY_ACC=CAM_ASM_000453 /LENGTH=103 /DNA_ID=CAMNT_0023260587 /DNA_START=540 /DNA_END=848 /DNA_ORIENTATION=-
MQSTEASSRSRAADAPAAQLRAHRGHLGGATVVTALDQARADGRGEHIDELAGRGAREDREVSRAALWADVEGHDDVGHVQRHQATRRVRRGPEPDDADAVVV